MDHLSERQLTDFVQGELSDDLHAQAEAHLSECSVCTEALRHVTFDLPQAWLEGFEDLRKESGHRRAHAGGETQPLTEVDDWEALPLVPSRGSAIDSYHSDDIGRFLPGTLLSNRYRIVSALGQGGMGEVYRADDLRLGQPVALKFLTPMLVRSEAAVQLFHREVTLARQISHPYVCRMYDIGEVAGELFLSMEYIDGEDLDTLLRRIGHLSPIKAMEIAQQLTAGLAAAHDCNVIHRDLKPANVMIDGQGRVRITDFGLACLIDQEVVRRGVVGTPAYMAPEQLLHGETSIQSDLYSLGLILYEIFAGAPVHRGKTLHQLRDEHRDTTTDVLVRLPREVDPSVQRMIQRCLANNPDRRPRSAHHVAEALPVSNPLANALARGETPSPELVATGDGQAHLSARFATPILIVLILGVLGTAWNSLGQLGGYMHTAEFPLKPDVLEYNAREIVAAAGYDRAYTWSAASGDPFIDTAFGLAPNVWYSFSSDNVRATSPFHYWFRVSPDYLVPDSTLTTQASWDNPPPNQPGMVRLATDLEGRLVYFEAVPPRRIAPEEEERPEVNWSKFLTYERIGIQMSDLERVKPMLVPPVPYDTRAAWQQISEPGGQSVVIEAAAFAGRPVFYRARLPDEDQQSPLMSTELLTNPTRVVMLAMLGVAALLVPANLRQRRSDLTGAIRVAFYFLIASILLGIFSAHLAANVYVGSVAVMSSIRRGVFVGALIWLYYIALEPYVRRFWPGTLITWSRLLQGQWRDALVGRDLLLGLTVGVGVQVVARLLFHIAELLGIPNHGYYYGDPNAILNMRLALGTLLECHLLAISTAMFALMFLFVLRLLLPVKGVASLLFVIFHTVQFSLPNGPTEEPVTWTISLVFWTCCLALLVRYGIISVIAFFFVSHCIQSFPIASNLSCWYLTTSLLPLVTIGLGGLAAWYLWHPVSQLESH